MGTAVCWWLGSDSWSTMIRMGVSGWMFLLVPAYPGCPGSKAVKRSLLLLLSGTTQVSRYQKGKTSVDFSEARDSEWHGISWAICKSAPSSRQITMPAPYHSVSYRLDALPAAQPTASMHWRQLKTEPVVKHKHIGMKPGIYILFVFDLDGECKFIKKKTL